jgi:hypothetical protein
VDDKGAEFKISELCKIGCCNSRVLQVTKDHMMHHHHEHQGYLQFPVLIGDKNSAANKCKEVHFKHAMHLVNKLRHENSKHYA